MPAILGNLGPGEIVLILIIAVLIFGDRLPEAASKAYLQFRKLRQSVDDLRRESGIDRELHRIERSVREAAWEARVDPELRAPLEPRAPRAALSPPASRPAEPPAPPAPEPASPPPEGETGEAPRSP